MRIKKNIKKIGYFWLPSDPNNKLAGLLSIQDGGEISIELHGLFGKNPYEIWKLWHFEVILGDIEEYGKVTLIDSKYSKVKRDGQEIKLKNIVECDYAFIGAHFNTKDELQFKSFVFRVEGLNEWTGVSGIKIDHDDILNPTISYKEPKEIKVYIDHTFNLTFDFYTSRTMGLHAMSAKDHVEIHQDTYLNLFTEHTLI